MAYSAKFGQIEQLIKSQYVIINRRDVSVNVGRARNARARARIVLLSETRDGRDRDFIMRGGHFVEEVRRKFHTRYEVSCARGDRRVFIF